jgi:hypothetical protein
MRQRAIRVFLGGMRIGRMIIGALWSKPVALPDARSVEPSAQNRIQVSGAFADAALFRTRDADGAAIMGG